MKREKNRGCSLRYYNTDYFKEIFLPKKILTEDVYLTVPFSTIRLDVNTAKEI